jgi:type IV secretory pathway TrbF-like protein
VSSKAQSAINAPAVSIDESAINRSRDEYEGRMGTAVVLRRFMTLWAVCATLVSVALAASIWVMMPLKTIQPYVVEVNKMTGEARAASAGISAKNFQPGEAERTRVLAQFVDNVLGIDPRKDITSDRIERASEVARGKASEQLASHLRKTTPIKVILEDPNFSRRVTVRAVNFIRDASTASIQVRIEDQTVGRPATQKNYIVKADYAFDPPKNLDEITRNPLGMYVIDFAINEDVR